MMVAGSTHFAASYSAVSKLIACRSSGESSAVNVSATSAVPFPATPPLLGLDGIYALWTDNGSGR